MYPHHVFNLEPAGTFRMYPICYWWVSGGYLQPEPAMYSRCFHWFPGPLAPSERLPGECWCAPVSINTVLVRKPIKIYWVEAKTLTPADHLSQLPIHIGNTRWV